MRIPPRALIAFPALLATLAALFPPGSPAWSAEPAKAAKPAAKPLNYLADTVLVARVEGRTIRVRDFVRAYFKIDKDSRPGGGAEGREQFLETLIDKEVLAAVARSAKRSETFEDRTLLRTQADLILANVLYRRTVLDSARVSEAEARAVYEEMKRELRLSRIRFGTREGAERMRRDLMAGRLPWSRAWDLRVRVPGDTARTSDLGWVTRGAAAPIVAEQVFLLPVGGISPVIPEPPAHALYLVKEERSVELESFSTLRARIIEGLRDHKTRKFRERLLSDLRVWADLRLDSANVIWTADHFPVKYLGAGTAHMVVDVSVPDLAPEDTARVVATFTGGRITVGRILEHYRATEELQRPNLSTVEAVRELVDGLVLEPRLAEAARATGFDRDPLAIRQIELKREEMSVERLFQDSILSRVRVSPDERRAYYRTHPDEFTTPPTVRYAGFRIGDSENADSVAARLRRGIAAQQIIRGDSLQGFWRGAIESRRLDETWRPHHQLLFEKLKPGDVHAEGPDEHGAYTVVQLMERFPAKTTPYEEADAAIDERLRQEAADRLMAGLIERHRKRMKIESHPELLMRVDLSPPREEAGS